MPGRASQLGAFPSAIYRLLVASASAQHHRGLARLWEAAWRAACRRWDGEIVVRLHGRRVAMNFGYLYPVYARLYADYNRPLVDAVNNAAAREGRSVFVVDVGAAIGDTALLLKQRCGAGMGGILCVDGDAEFLDYLHRNLDGDPDVEIRAALLSRGEDAVPGLVRTHRGTASAVGDCLMPATTLDDVIAQADSIDRRIDIIKVDVDGYDGAVLAGARGVLARWHPDVLFEWHPLLYERAGNDQMEPFRVLADLGYREFRWFTKYGAADGLMNRAINRGEIERRVQASLSCPADDIHWDVLALAVSKPAFA